MLDSVSRMHAVVLSWRAESKSEVRSRAHGHCRTSRPINVRPTSPRLSRVTLSRAQKHFISVILEKPPLRAREPSRLEHPPRRHAHALHRSVVRDRGDQQPPVRAERDEAAIEEVVDRGRQQQAVLAVEALGVGGVAPRLAVARAQVFGTVDAGDAAARFDGLHALLEETLAAAGEDERFFYGLVESGIELDALAQVFFPDDELGVELWGRGELRLGDEFGEGEVGDFAAEEVGELQGERLRQFS